MMTASVTGPKRSAKTVGLLGIGLVGRAVARLLLDAGFTVVGYAPSLASREALRALGGRPADSVAEVGRACGRVVLAVFNTSQVEEVVEGEGGLLAVAPPAGESRVVINLSTCEPERIIALNARTRARAAFVEMPISGTAVQIAKGEGVGLVGGERADIESVDSVLAVICPRRYCVGGVGGGAKDQAGGQPDSRAEPRRHGRRDYLCREARLGYSRVSGCRARLRRVLPGHGCKRQEDG